MRLSPTRARRPAASAMSGRGKYGPRWRVGGEVTVEQRAPLTRLFDGQDGQSHAPESREAEMPSWTPWNVSHVFTTADRRFGPYLDDMNDLLDRAERNEWIL